MGYIIKKVLDTDPETGLLRELWLTRINIDSESGVITVNGFTCLVSPTGKCIRQIEQIEYTRYNSISKQKYDALEQSAVGAGIKAMLQMDIDLYPDFEQKP